MFDKLKRQDSGVISNDKDGGSTALVDIQVVVPTRFERLGFCTIDAKVRLIGIMAILHGKDKYKLVNMPVMFVIEPNKIEQMEIDGVGYFVFHISKGAPFADRNVVRPDGVVKPLIEETIMKGNIPAYLSYDEYRATFEALHKFVGSTIADDVTIMSIFVSINARSPEDPNMHIRLLKDKSKIKWVGLNNVALSRTDAFSQLTGANMRDGLVAAAIKDQGETALEKLYE